MRLSHAPLVRLDFSQPCREELAIKDVGEGTVPEVVAEAGERHLWRRRQTHLSDALHPQ